MTKEKQIEEMAEFMTEGIRPWAEDAEALYNAGYRKASEVASEIFEELRKAGITELRYPVIAELKKKYTGEKHRCYNCKHCANANWSTCESCIDANNWESEDTE